MVYTCFWVFCSSKCYDGNDECIRSGHRVLAVRVVSFLTQVKMRDHHTVSRVVDAQTGSAKLVRDSVVTTGFAHQKIGVNLRQGRLECPNILAQCCNVRVELQSAVLTNVVARKTQDCMEEGVVGVRKT